MATPVSTPEITVLERIETAAGLANFDAILDVSGIDGVYVGPADLALSLGHAPSLDTTAPEVLDAIAAICARARARGLVAGIPAGAGATARTRLDEGFNFVALGTDISLFERGVAQQLALVRDAGGVRAEGQY